MKGSGSSSSHSEIGTDDSVYFQFFKYNAVSNIVVEPDGTISKCNLTFERTTGYSKKEIEGRMNALEIVSGKDVKRVEGFLKNRTLEGGDTPSVYKCSMVCRDGSSRIMQLHVKMLDEEGRRIVSLIDLTELLDIENALTESERRFRDLAELMPEALFELDLEGNLVYANQIAFSKFGYSRIDLIKGKNYLQLIHPDDRDRARENLRSKLEGREIQPAEYTALRSDGSTFPVTVNISIIYEDGEPTGIRGTVIDNTLSKEYEDSLRYEKDLSRFYIDLLTHDIGNIHQGLKGNIQIALMTCSENTRGYLRNALNSLHQSERLVRNVKVLSALSSKDEKWEKNGLLDMINSVVDHLRSIHIRMMEISVHADDNADPEVSELLRELLFNVLHNSLVHNDKERIIIDIDVQQKESGIVVSIKDNGPGYPDTIIEHVKHLRGNGISADENRIGSGFSLIMSIAETLGLDIHVDNKDDGSLTTITIP